MCSWLAGWRGTLHRDHGNGNADQQQRVRESGLQCVLAPAEPCLSPHSARHFTDCQCCARAHDFSRTGGMQHRRLRRSYPAEHLGCLVRVLVPIRRYARPSGSHDHLLPARLVGPAMPLLLPPMNFTGCPNQWLATSATRVREDATCTGECDGGGEYCPLDRSATPMSGRHYLPVGVAGLLEASCIPCAPGAYNPDEGGTRCLTCPAGKLSESVRSTECSDCPSGGFCSAEGAASLRQTFTPCPAGTFNPEGGQTSSAACQACPPGQANPITGSSDPANCRDCSAGFVAAASGAAFCDRCAAGKYQANEGEQACVDCKPGSYCPKGQPPLPCAEGTYSNATNLTSASECEPCPTVRGARLA